MRRAEFLEGLERLREEGAEEGPEAVRIAGPFLEYFGFLEPGMSFSGGLERFQQYHRLLPTGRLTEETILIMSRARCGHGRFKGRILLASSAVRCPRQGLCRRKSNERELVYRVERGLTEPPGSEVDAVKDAFRAWNGLQRVHFFHETERPDSDVDIEVSWTTPAIDQDFDLRGLAVAHSDFPGQCRRIPSGKIPIHFDKGEHFWGGTRLNIKLVAMHEIGHILGLDDCPADQPSVMFDTFQDGELDKILSAEDQQVYSTLYP